MKKPKRKPPPKVEDPAQSQRFLDLAHELEAAGELSPTDEGDKLEHAMKSAFHRMRRATKESN